MNTQSHIDLNKTIIAEPSEVTYHKTLFIGANEQIPVT